MEPGTSVRKPLAEYYGDYYYAHSCGADTPCRRGEPAWIQFFGALAERVITELAPSTVLDAGCSIGMLVEALRDRGVDAWGFDFSEYAIGQVREDMRPFCQVASITQPLERDYDLITCIEILEHLPPEEVEAAVANLTTHTEQVLFSSTPTDYREPTHLNVQPPDYWAGLFARHGFYRELDFETSFVSQHAVLFRRQRGIPVAVIRAYERRCYDLTMENRELRSSYLASNDTVASQSGEIQALKAEIGRLSDLEVTFGPGRRQASSERSGRFSATFVGGLRHMLIRLLARLPK